ncbi:hypothetical protein J7I93_24030 [Bacillus sp. ISL-47]|uniref:hypothetical protein n=1 Tax=Bacillus sp. ISL-47 TaxID=2819130 RepID=UPI001BE689A4|nr:hypothetical protein [Bacillus sp. ISL-47]MBT2691208.1 hypothetical protein [Bacillus sp. ISL-47]MBT2709904.1 hypothetical protein [Pseudomonas sp. ISL-84]
MNIIADNGFYEVEYDNEHYEHLEFVRIDHICEITYVTLKNILTGEVYTFDTERIKRFRKIMKVLPSFKENPVADNSSYSL